MLVAKELGWITQVSAALPGNWFNPKAVRPQEVVMQALLKALWTDESGQDTTEYVLLVALIALAVTAGMTILATNINEAFSETGSILDGYVSS